MRRLGLGLLLLFAAGILYAAPTPTAEVQVLREIPSTYVYPMDGHIPMNIHRGTPTLLSLMLPGSTFNNPQGVACALLKATDDPKDPLDDVEITVLGLNSGAGEIFYNVGLRSLKKLGTTGRGPNQFQDPMGVAIHPNGDAAVGDTGNDRVVLLHHDGYRLAWVRAVGKKGKAPGEFDKPWGVAFDSAGNLYVADHGNQRIQVKDPKGTWRVLPIEGLEGPTALAVIDHADPWTFYTSGVYADRLAVVDRAGARLQTFTLDGKPLTSVGAEGAWDQPFRLTACAFDYFGHVVATDSPNGCLRKFDRDLKPLATYGSTGEGDFHFQSPRGVCLNRQLGQMIVSEESCAQYMWVGSDALNLRTEGTAGAVTFRFYLTEASFLTADIVGEDGKKVARVADNIMMDERDRALVWTPAPGTAPGPYRLDLSVMATYSSRDRLAKVETLPFRLEKAVEALPAAGRSPAPRARKEGAPAGASRRTLGQALRESRAVVGEVTFTPTPSRTLGQALEATRVTKDEATPTATPAVPTESVIPTATP